MNISVQMVKRLNNYSPPPNMCKYARWRNVHAVWVLHQLQRYQQKYQTHKSLIPTLKNKRPECLWAMAGSEFYQVKTLK